MMLAALASFTLIFTPSNGGPITVVEGLSQNACEEALSFAEFGKTIAERERDMQRHFDAVKAAGKYDPNSSNYTEIMEGRGRCVPYRINNDTNANATASAGGQGVVDTNNVSTGGTNGNQMPVKPQTATSKSDSGKTVPNAGGGPNPNDPGTPNSSVYRTPASSAPPIAMHKFDPMSYTIGMGIGGSPFGIGVTKTFRYGDKK